MFIDTLIHVSTIETRQASYEFSLVGVWRDPATGLFWYSSDSGCSCPSPWENHNDLSDFCELNSETWPNLVKLVMTRDSGEWGLSGAARQSWLHRLSETIAEQLAEPFTAINNPFTR